MIQTQRTHIVPLEQNHFDSLIEMYLEPESNKYVAPLRDKPKSFFQGFLERKLAQNEMELGFWVVLENDSSKVIGTVNLNWFFPLSIFHIGCHLKRDYWNKGFATELLSALIHYGFEIKKVDQIHGIVEKDNSVSKKLMGNLGFEFDRAERLENMPLEIYKLYKS
ncbi:MAG: GNAT family N-acetyltransferase [Flavobacteriales bacterium]|nr:GNAT family N-acetyltransferase [Flavobacteriales bacterium]